MIVSVYGYHLGPRAGCVGKADPLRRETANALRPVQTAVELAVFPKRLCDVEVRVGGVAAGLLYVQAMQINFQMPQGVGVTGVAAVVKLGSGQRTESAERLADGDLRSRSGHFESPRRVGRTRFLPHPGDDGLGW